MAGEDLAPVAETLAPAATAAMDVETVVDQVKLDAYLSETLPMKNTMRAVVQQASVNYFNERKDAATRALASAAVLEATKLRASQTLLTDNEVNLAVSIGRLMVEKNMLEQDAKDAVATKEAEKQAKLK